MIRFLIQPAQSCHPLPPSCCRVVLAFGDCSTDAAHPPWLTSAHDTKTGSLKTCSIAAPTPIPCLESDACPGIDAIDRPIYSPISTRDVSCPSSPMSGTRSSSSLCLSSVFAFPLHDLISLIARPINYLQSSFSLKYLSLALWSWLHQENTRMNDKKRLPRRRPKGKVVDLKKKERLQPHNNQLCP
jgi:hypothetical protein